MKTIKKYGIDLDMQDSQGWKWGGHAALWAYSLESAMRAGALYAEHVNARGNGEKVTGYKAYEMIGA